MVFDLLLVDRRIVDRGGRAEEATTENEENEPSRSFYSLLGGICIFFAAIQTIQK